MTELNIMSIPTLLKVALMGTLVGCRAGLDIMSTVILDVGDGIGMSMVDWPRALHDTAVRHSTANRAFIVLCKGEEE